MTTSIIDILLRGQNRTGSAFQEVQGDLRGTESSALNLAGALVGKLAIAFSTAGAAAGAMKLGALFLEFGNLGEVVSRSEKYFKAFSGSTKMAADNLAAMQKATEGAVSTQEAMTIGASILGMGLATNADELEKFARMAVVLGGNTRTAAEAISDFQLLLANQSVERLDTFGISSGKVRARIVELQDATAGLSREQAFLQAVMEDGTKKLAQLEAEGVRAGTSQDRLLASTKNLKAELAKLVEQPYTIIIERVTKEVASVVDAFGEANENRVMVNVEAGVEERLAAISSSIKRLEEQKAQFNDGTPLSLFNQAVADKQIVTLQNYAAQLKAYGKGAEDVKLKLNDYLAASLRLSSAQEEVGKISIFASSAVKQMAQAELEAAQAARDSSLAAYQAAEGYARLAVDTDEAAAAQYRYYAAARTAASAPLPGRRFDDDLGLSDRMSGGASTIAPATPVRGSKAWNEMQTAEANRSAFLRESNKAIAKDAGTSYADAMKEAGRETASVIESLLGEAVSNASGLLDLTPDTMKPGANGAFENIYRALDVAKLGDASPWAKQLGLTQEEAKKIGEDFQRNIFSEGVVSLIDESALVSEVKMSQLADKSKAAFISAIAKKAGVGESVVGALFGLSSKDDAKGEKSQMEDAMQKVAVALGDSIKGEAFVKKIAESAQGTWVYFETSFVNAAKMSSALRDAIMAMFHTALTEELE